MITRTSKVFASAELQGLKKNTRHSIPTHIPTSGPLSLLYTPTHTPTAVFLPFIFAGGRDRKGELPVASSATARSHLQNTQSRPSHQSVLQLRLGSGVTRRRERKKAEREGEKQR